MSEELVTVPADLTLVSDDDLHDLETQAVAEFDRLSANENVDPDEIQYQARLAEGIDRIRAEKRGRAARTEENSRLEKARLADQRATLTKLVHGDQPNDGGAGGNGGGNGSPVIDAEAIAEATARGTVAAFASMLGQRTGGGPIDITSMQKRANTALSAARAHAPAEVTPRGRLAVTAGVDIPGVARGKDLSFDELTEATIKAARGLPATRDGSGQERLVASIRNEFEHVVDDRTSPGVIEELLKHLRRPEKINSLVAGGGWCAPSEIRYDFFNVAGVDGLVDLPTVGITRGGLQFPVSPSIADAFGTTGLAPFAVAFSSGSDPWLWTESDDAASVTGASPRKPTMRVPCPTFTNVRLECYGITLTAGNLTDDAYPEATANTLRLLLTAWQHAQNARIIQQMVSLSGTAITGIGGAGAPAFQTFMNGLDLAATDYRAKYAITDETVLEVVAPFWMQDVIAADLAWRPGVSDLLSVANAEVQRYAAARNVRVQWVNDWQVRGTNQFGNPTTPMTAWPTTCDLLVYAAGTFIKGNGLNLDLGVVRDSTLNATNDFTAAWSEECHLVARVGNESRRYTFTFAVDGAVGGSAYALGSPTARI